MVISTRGTKYTRKNLTPGDHEYSGVGVYESRRRKVLRERIARDLRSYFVQPREKSNASPTNS